MAKSPESGTGKHNRILDPNIDPELGSMYTELDLLRNNLAFYKDMMMQDQNALLKVAPLEAEIRELETKIEARKVELNLKNK